MPKTVRIESNTYLPRMKLTLLIVGETGAGKSSLINMLASEDCAKASCDARGTESWKAYSFQMNSDEVCAYDTVGFGLARYENSDNISPYEAALDMLQSLKVKVDLILLCTKGDNLGPTTRCIYHLFSDFFFEKTVPIALIVTHREKEKKKEMDNWWGRNQGAVKNCNFAEHACVTLSHKDSSLYKKSRESVIKLLLIATSHRPSTLDKPIIPLFKRCLANREDFLAMKCGLSRSDALFLTRKADSRIRVTNIVLFGEAGVGKSSIINLIAGENRAITSSGADPCTLDSTEYRLHTKTSCLRIFDTAGLNSMSIRGEEYLDAVGKAVELIGALKRVGGVDLLLFCMRGGRILENQKSNYLLFYEFLCKKKVPVVILITNLENEEVMEDWWKKNQHFLTGNGIECKDHACITAISGKNDIHKPKLNESRESILKILEGINTSGKPFVVNSDLWLSGFLKDIMKGLVEKKERPSERVLRKKLKKRLPKDRAKVIAQKVYSSHDDDHANSISN